MLCSPGHEFGGQESSKIEIQHVKEKSRTERGISSEIVLQSHWWH
jgi:hypothetical protein